MADEGDVINFYAGARYTFDDNIFRRSDKSLAGPEDERITTLIAGLNFDKTVSRQRFVGDLSINSNSYENFSYLDYDAPNARVRWDWRAGNLWKGEVAYNYSKALTDFRDQLVSLQRNVVTRNEGSVSANYQFHPDWAALTLARLTTTRNDADFRKSLDLDQTTWELGVLHLRPSGNRFIVTARWKDGDYVNRVFVPGVSTVDDGFDQKDLEFRVVWNPGGQGDVDARAAWTRRTNPHLSQRDFSGLTGSLSYDWLATGKSSVKFSLAREIQPYDDVTTIYVDRRRFKVAPTWNPTSKISLEAGIEFQKLYFESDPGSLVVNQREDRYRTLFATASHSPWRYAVFSVGLSYEKRNSNFSIIDYTDKLGFVSAQLTY